MMIGVGVLVVAGVGYYFWNESRKTKVLRESSDRADKLALCQKEMQPKRFVNPEAKEVAIAKCVEEA